jgi:hypothetical protein
MTTQDKITRIEALCNMTDATDDEAPICGGCDEPLIRSISSPPGCNWFVCTCECDTE